MLTDFHTHILPGVDDGSDSILQSLEMLRILKKQNMSRVVATPHFYPSSDHPKRFLVRRAMALEQLEAALEPDMPRIIPAAEVRYFDGLSDCEQLEELTIGSTPYLLVEMPGTPWTERMYRELQEIWQKRSITPVIAHVDRYISPFHTHHIPERLKELPVLVQANANFFLRRTSRSMAMKMLRDGQIHCLGSDCHNTSTRPPNLDKAVVVIAKALGADGLCPLVEWENRIFQHDPNADGWRIK